jgi:hypothetical protein
MTPLAPEPRYSVEALSFLYVCLGGTADGDYESSLEIHVPQAFAADGCAHVLCIQRLGRRGEAYPCLLHQTRARERTPRRSVA